MGKSCGAVRPGADRLSYSSEQGITVNAVCPGYVLTPLVEKQIPDTAKARGISR